MGNKIKLERLYMNRKSERKGEKGKIYDQKVPSPRLRMKVRREGRRKRKVKVNK